MPRWRHVDGGAVMGRERRQVALRRSPLRNSCLHADESLTDSHHHANRKISGITYELDVAIHKQNIGTAREVI
jgi:hypothetical protein